MQPSQIRLRWETSYLRSDTRRCVGRPHDADHLRRCRSVESSVDDFRTGRGVVLGRAVPMLRSVETQPLTGGFVLMVERIQFFSLNFIHFVKISGFASAVPNFTAHNLCYFYALLQIC